MMTSTTVDSSSRKHSIQIRTRNRDDRNNADSDGDQDLDGIHTSSSLLHPHVNIPATSVLQLILAHLTEQGLHESVKALQKESQTGMAASFVKDWLYLATTGQWDAILSAISVLDTNAITLDLTLRSQVYQHVILELADEGEWETAYALFRIFQLQQHQTARSENDYDGTTARKNRNSTYTQRPAKKINVSVDAKLADLAARRAKDSQCQVPEDYYSMYRNNDDPGTTPTGGTRQACRQWIGQQLQQTIPRQPPDRLISLLQQAIKWQSYTGQLPTNGKQIFDLVLGQVDGGDVVPDRGFRMLLGHQHHQQRKKKIVKKPAITIKFGKRATCETAAFLSDGSALVTGSSDGLVEIWDVYTGQPIPRLARNSATAEQTLEQQQEEVIMAHDTAVTALAVSNDTTIFASGGTDGTVNVWRTDSGKLLRQLETKAYVSCLAFHPAGDRILVAGQDGSCREYGLRGARILQEFIAASSGDGVPCFLTQCLYTQWPMSTTLAAQRSNYSTMKQHKKRKYQHEQQDLLHDSGGQEFPSILTAHGDGTVRVWDATTGGVVLVLRPMVASGNHNLIQCLPGVGSSLVASDRTVSTGSAAIVSIHCLHTPLHSVLIVVRNVRSFLCDSRGTVLRVYDIPVDSSKTRTTAGTATTTTPPAVIVAATVSFCNRWLYAATEDGVCHIFDVATGELERSLWDFGVCSTTNSSNKEDNATTTVPTPKALPELSSIIYHPNSDLIAAFSSDKSQRKGKLVMWR